MGDLWEKWWPTILGVLLLGVAGFFLWPKGSAPIAREQPPLSQVGLPAASGTDADRGADLRRQRELEDARRRTALRSANAERGPEPPPSEPAPAEPPRTAPTAGQRPVTLTQDSPEVRRTLRLVEVELYETHWCQYCKKTRAFLDQNGIQYRAYDVEADEAAKLRKDRLAPRTGVPLTVIDGETVTGFSEAALNAAFQTAIRRRLTGR